MGHAAMRNLKQGSHREGLICQTNGFDIYPEGTRESMEGGKENGMVHLDFGNITPCPSLKF